MSYVTTMSFVPSGQLGAAPGLQVETYYYWLNKTVGFQNTASMYLTAGTISDDLLPAGEGDGSWSIINRNQTSGSGEDNGLRLYYDLQQNETTGSAVTGSSTDALYDDDYNDGITILTGSVEGNTRIRVSCGVGINITTSSIADFFRPAFPETGKGGGGPVSPVTSIVKLKIYRDVGGDGSNIELIDQVQKSINPNNDYLVLANGGFNNSNANYLASTDDPTNSPAFSWAPNQAAFPSIVTDYFDVTQNDIIYAKLELPEENTASFGGMTDNGYFTESLFRHRNTAALRSYGYFGGHLIMNQETPEGANFINGVTGITASYFTTKVMV